MHLRSSSAKKATSSSLGAACFSASPAFSFYRKASCIAQWEVIIEPSSQAMTMHTRTHEQVDLTQNATHLSATAERGKIVRGRFKLTPEHMRRLVKAFTKALDLGLTKPKQVVPMEPTFVFGWPSRQEQGDFLTLDLGGTNLRVCLVTLQGEGKCEITQSKYQLKDEQKQEEGQKLFDFCAECLKKFIDAHLTDENGGLQPKPGENLPLGFTFSYPCSQERIDHGKLIRWTKGFRNPHTEGQDVAAMFRKSLEKFKLPIELTALVNDTTGTLIASHYANARTKIAVVFGTGCNAAYMEHVKNITKIKHLGIDDDTQMAITALCGTTGAGAFDSFEHEHLPRTKYDVIVDETSTKPGEQAFEKLISGLYLGEILRLILCELIDEDVLFHGQDTSRLETPYALDTTLLSLMESDETDDLLTVIGIFVHFFALETTIEEREFFRAVANLIVVRAARLGACGIAAIVSKMDYLEEGCLVGVEGSLYNKYPGFVEMVHEGLQDIFGEQGRNIITHHAEDGSGLGSAIIAAMTRSRLDAGLYPNL
ncbi:hexokinase [Mycena capillaripes]|nr:hexokinase [Mycena capillaripes]